MKYFFILGTNPALSIAEILNVLGGSLVNFDYRENKEVFIVETKKELDPTKIMSRLGGTIKIGEIKNKSSRDRNELLQKIKSLLAPSEGKFKFGFSYYGSNNLNTRALGMETKKYLRENGVSCRWVTSQEKVLSSVVVEQNKLIHKGLELVFIEENKELLIGTTKAVQPFKALSFRDYGRPARDDESGMLPPKLAQIMLNLAQADFDDVLLDPFCGSGTILTEAMLMGYKNLIGTDLGAKAIADTKKNISWIAKKFDVKNYKIQTEIADIKNLLSVLTENSVDAIVTEPYLGPQRGQIDLKYIIPELEKLYSQGLNNFKKVLQKNKYIVIIFPIFFKKHYLKIDLKSWEKINPLPPSLMISKKIKLSPRGALIYGRAEQKVWREVLILKNI